MLLSPALSVILPVPFLQAGRGRRVGREVSESEADAVIGVTMKCMQVVRYALHAFEVTPIAPSPGHAIFRSLAGCVVPRSWFAERERERRATQTG